MANEYASGRSNETTDAAYQIEAFLRGKGLSRAAIAGIMGNLHTESGYNSHAHNAREGAIGIAQWEGGRRTALQSYASSHGGSETDLNIQLGFLWHELSGMKSTLHALNTSRSAGEAATIWDSQYERSAGTTREARIAAANQAYSGKGLSSYTPSTGGGGTAAAVHTTRSSLSSSSGLGKLLSTVPELKHLVDQAVQNDWSSEHFQNQIENSHWYKTHSSTARSVLTQQTNDPATYRQNRVDAWHAVDDLSHQLGMPLKRDQWNHIIDMAMMTGNAQNTQWLTQQIAGYQDFSRLKSTNGLRGQMAATVQQLQASAADYGYRPSVAGVAGRALNILRGATTADTYKQQWITWAKGAFPSLSKALDAGQTVKELADPYVSSMSNLLETKSGIDVFNPMIQKALQGGTDPATKQKASTPIWQFEQQVRADPRWQYTNNAKDSMSSMLVKLGQDWGFGF